MPLLGQDREGAQRRRVLARAEQHHGGADFVPVAEGADDARFEIDGDDELAGARRGAFVPEPVAIADAALDRQDRLDHEGIIAGERDRGRRRGGRGFEHRLGGDHPHRRAARGLDDRLGCGRAEGHLVVAGKRRQAGIGQRGILRRGRVDQRGAVEIGIDPLERLIGSGGDQLRGFGSVPGGNGLGQQRRTGCRERDKGDGKNERADHERDYAARGEGFPAVNRPSSLTGTVAGDGLTGDGAVFCASREFPLPFAAHSREKAR